MQYLNFRFGFGNLRGAGLSALREFFHASGQSTGFFAQQRDYLHLRRAAGFPLHGLGSGLRQFRIHLGMTPSEFLGALPVERNTIFAAVDFKRREIQNILVLTDLGVQFVNPLIQPVLLAFLLLDGRGALQFRGVQFFQLLGHAFCLGVQFARLACQHLANDAAHLLADFGIAARLGSLAL